ncbi:MAG TPA: alpha/beta hydrolase [Alphaproteobacteria bacterium]|nr:alpha/beta hydrolase [Alphaproteobacteria bacterium]HOO52063.1 alpha/beta hydrolase [Alphaproteobacteria bacterium]
MAFEAHTFQTYTPSGKAYTLHYKIWGANNPKDKTLICVHGLTGNSGDFRYIGEQLSTEENMRVVAIDMAGRNDSDYFEDPLDYNFEQYLKDIDGLLKEIDCTAPASCDWLGVSMGGLIGFYVAGRENSPIRRLVLDDIGPEVPKEDLEYIAQFITTPAEYDRPEDLVPLLKMALGSPYSRGNMSEDQWLHFARTYTRKNNNGKFGRNMDAGIAVMFHQQPLGTLDLWEVWKQVSQPILAIRGGLSTLFPQYVADKMLKTKNGNRIDLVTMEDCGHVPSLYRRDQIDIIADWLRHPPL